MKKAVLSAMILALLLPALLFATGGQEGAEAPSADGQITVQFMHLWGNPAEKEIIDEVIATFEAENPDITVEQLVFESTAYHTKILQLLAGNDPPDVFLSYPGFKTYDLVDRDVLRPLTGMWERYDLAEYFSEGARTSVAYEGDVWNLPWVTHANIVVYNKRIFDSLELEVPRTLEEFEEVAEAIKAEGIYPFTSGWKALYRSAYPFELLTPSYGGPEAYVQLAALKEDWDQPLVRQVLDKWDDWIEREYWYPDPRSRSWPEGLGLLAEGRAAMSFIGTYATSVLSDAGMEYGVDYDIFVFPQINDDYPVTLTGPFDALSIPKKATEPEAAERLLAFMASTKAQSIRAEAGGLVLNRNVTSYGPEMMNVKQAVDGGASFQPGFFQATPPIGLELINHGVMPDFYDNPDHDGYIQRANDAREQYLNQ